MSDKNIDTKKIIKQAAKGITRGAIGATVTLGTMVATGNPLIGLGAGYLYLSNDSKMLNAFKLGLQRWRQEKGQSPTMKAKLLRFRNSVSYGLSTAHAKDKENKHNLRMKYDPYYREAYVKAQKEGRKFGLINKLKVNLNSYVATQNAAVSRTRANPTINQEIINKLYRDRINQRR